MSSRLRDLYNSIKRSFKKKNISQTRSESYSYKGSGYQGKGGVNTDAATFNKTRKGQ